MEWIKKQRAPRPLFRERYLWERHQHQQNFYPHICTYITCLPACLSTSDGQLLDGPLISLSVRHWISYWRWLFYEQIFPVSVYKTDLFANQERIWIRNASQFFFMERLTWDKVCRLVPLLLRIHSSFYTWRRYQPISEKKFVLPITGIWIIRISWLSEKGQWELGIEIVIIL